MLFQYVFLVNIQTTLTLVSFEWTQHDNYTLNVMETPVISKTRRSKMACAILISGYEDNIYFTFNNNTNVCHGYISGSNAQFAILPEDFGVYEITSKTQSIRMSIFQSLKKYLQQKTYQTVVHTLRS